MADLAAEAQRLVRRLREGPYDDALFLDVARFEARTGRPIATGDLLPPAAALAPLAGLVACRPEARGLHRLLRELSQAHGAPGDLVVWHDDGGRLRVSMAAHPEGAVVEDADAAPEAARWRPGLYAFEVATAPWWPVRISREWQAVRGAAVQARGNLVAEFSRGFFRDRPMRWDARRGCWRAEFSEDVWDNDFHYRGYFRVPQQTAFLHCEVTYMRD